MVLYINYNQPRWPAGCVGCLRPISDEFIEIVICDWPKPINILQFRGNMMLSPFIYIISPVLHFKIINIKLTKISRKVIHENPVFEMSVFGSGPCRLGPKKPFKIPSGRANYVSKFFRAGLARRFQSMLSIIKMQYKISFRL